MNKRDTNSIIKKLNKKSQRQHDFSAAPVKKIFLGLRVTRPLSKFLCDLCPLERACEAGGRKIHKSPIGTRDK